MKKLLVLFASTLFILGISTAAMAVTFDYTLDTPDESIENDSNIPNSYNWYNLQLPRWYESNFVTAFTIEMYGRNDNAPLPIDIWGKLGSNPGQAIVSYDVQNGYRNFILRMDLVHGDLYRNYQNSDLTWTGFVDTHVDLSSWPALSDFNGLSGFLIGYACHFTYDKTSLHLEQSQQSVPEPATMLLLGTGLIGLAGFGRKKLIKK